MSGIDSPLTPLRFLERAVEVYPNREAVVDGDRRLTYLEFESLVTRFARALIARGLRKGDRVMYLGANSAEMLAAHYAIPLAGGVLVAVNTRLSSAEIFYIAGHSEPVMLIGDADLVSALGPDSQASLGVRDLVIRGADDVVESLGAMSFATLLELGSDEKLEYSVDDETLPITINYTSGTTGRPKGVVYTHRGAYLNSIGELTHQGFTVESRYLWTLPMFHCNGWCTTWALTAAAGAHVCLPAVRGPEVWKLLDNEAITHLAGAPTVLSVIAEAAEAHPLDHVVTVVTAGAPPSPTIIAKMHALGTKIVHVYGLTETYGPYSVCELKPEWDGLPAHELAVLIARQGVGMLTSDRLRVVRQTEGDVLEDVSPDGTEMGELVMRGNSVMNGYYANPEATREAFRGGWFHSGDLGVMHPDGYVQVLDRLKDIVISGGENISTIEVEQTIIAHPAVADVAVVGVPHEKWGERPVAFIVVAASLSVHPDELDGHVRQRLAGFKAPERYHFVEALPKTSTGKTRKDELRARAVESG